MPLATTVTVSGSANWRCYCCGADTPGPEKLLKAMETRSLAELCKVPSSPLHVSLPFPSFCLFSSLTCLNECATPFPFLSPLPLSPSSLPFLSRSPSSVYLPLSPPLPHISLHCSKILYCCCHSNLLEMRVVDANVIVDKHCPSPVLVRAWKRARWRCYSSMEPT